MRRRITAIIFLIYIDSITHYQFFLISWKSVEPYYSQEIQKRCEGIVKMVEKEIHDVRKLEEEFEMKEEAKKLEAARQQNMGTQEINSTNA